MNSQYLVSRRPKKASCLITTIQFRQATANMNVFNSLWALDLKKLKHDLVWCKCCWYYCIEVFITNFQVSVNPCFKGNYGFGFGFYYQNEIYLLKPKSSNISDSHHRKCVPGFRRGDNLLPVVP